MKMPFARWENFRECELEMIDTGHDEESAKKICGAIQARAEKGQLYKSVDQQNYDIICKSDSELVIGGFASWELVDPENDLVTTRAQTRYLQKLFKLPREYRNIMVGHSNYKIGEPLLKYVKDGHEYFSHVNEKGLYLVATIRNDSFKTTQKWREKILKGEMSMYSIAGLPLESEIVDEGGTKIRKIYDTEPWEITICEKGVNPKTKFKILAKQEPKSDEERAKAHFNITDEEWNKLTEEQKKTLIDKLPARGSASKQKSGPTPGIEYDVVKITAVPNQIVLVERVKEISKADIEAVLVKHGFNKSIKKS